MWRPMRGGFFVTAFSDDARFVTEISRHSHMLLAGIDRVHCCSAATHGLDSRLKNESNFVDIAHAQQEHQQPI